jgi:phosphoserine aminotransferase
MLTMRWLKNNGGLPAMEALNRKKADMLYTAIDSNPMFKGTVAKEDRSIMNVNFIMENRDLEPDFLQYAKEHQCVGLNGHRSVGGFRASMYNALPLASVEHLVELMNEYTRIKG